MTTSTIDPPTTATPEDEARPPRRWVRWVLVAVCLPIVAMWVYAFGFASKEAAAHIDDKAWTERAEDICAAATDERDQLVDTRKITEAGPDALLERAAIVDQATAILERMLDEVVAQRPASAEDQRLVDKWEGYYRTYIADRRAYTEQLRNGGENRFNETAIDDGPVSRLIDDFVQPNRMSSCASPKDLS